MNIYIASDHRGFNAEKEITSYLKENGLSVINVCTEHNDTDDYPDFAYKLGKKVVGDKSSLGILICGTGIGMSIAANKIDGIRASRCVDVDDAFYSKNHNDANVICLGENIAMDYMKEIIDTFISTAPASEERHLNRVKKVIDIESGAYNEL